MTKEKDKTIIYAIDTTGPFCTVSLLITEEQGMEGSMSIIEETSDKKISHVQELLPLTETLLEKGKVKLKDIDVIAVSKGPGSYTGIRAGVSMARAFGQILNKPLIGVSSLEPFALIKEDDHLVCPIFNARRKQIYGGAYIGVSAGKRSLERTIIVGGPYLIDEFLEKLQGHLEKKEELKNKKIIFYGDGVDAYEEELVNFKKVLSAQRIEVIIDEVERYQRASAVSLRAYEIYLEEGAKPYYEVLPDYMKKVEAEEKLEEKKKAIRASLTYKVATSEDVPRITQIEKECFPNPWTEAMYREEIEKNKLATYVCALYEDQIIGFGGLWIIGNEGHITNVAVSPKYKNGGIGYLIGKELMAESENRAGTELNFTLEVRESNKAALSLYKKLGFNNVGKRPKYYGDEDAVIMWRIMEDE